MAKKVYEQAGGMNPAIMASEDLELSYKIIAMGKKI